MAEENAEKQAKKDWLAGHITYLSKLKSQTDTQKLLVFLAEKKERDAKEERTFAALVKSEKALERAKKARAEVTGLLAKEKEESTKAATKARHYKLTKLGLLFGYVGLDDAPRDFLAGLLMTGAKLDSESKQQLSRDGATLLAEKEPPKPPAPAPTAADTSAPPTAPTPSASPAQAPLSAPTPPPTASAPTAPNLVCQPLKTDDSVGIRAGVPDFVHSSDEIFEHPSIPGLMLTRGQRLYPFELEYLNKLTGEVAVEEDVDRRYRIKWQKPVPMTESSTSKDFVKMNPDIFKKKT